MSGLTLTCWVPGAWRAFGKIILIDIYGFPTLFASPLRPSLANMSRICMFWFQTVNKNSFQCYLIFNANAFKCKPRCWRSSKPCERVQGIPLKLHFAILDDKITFRFFAQLVFLLVCWWLSSQIIQSTDSRCWLAFGIWFSSFRSFCRQCQKPILNLIGHGSDYFLTLTLTALSSD